MAGFYSWTNITASIKILFILMATIDNVSTCILFRDLNNFTNISYIFPDVLVVLARRASNLDFSF